MFAKEHTDVFMILIGFFLTLYLMLGGIAQSDTPLTLVLVGSIPGQGVANRIRCRPAGKALNATCLPQIWLEPNVIVKNF